MKNNFAWEGCPRQGLGMVDNLGKLRIGEVKDKLIEL
jgi:hypothetical protein